MNEYEKIAKQLRKETSKVTMQQQREISKLYENSIKNISDKLAKSNEGSLNQAFLNANRKAIIDARNELNRNLNKSIKGYTTKAARIGTKGEEVVMGRAFSKAGLEVGKEFNNMFAKVNDNVIRDIISGGLYKDDKTLSNRIWNYGKEFENDMQYTIAQGILEKKSARELAKDLDKFSKPPNKRGKDWGDTYPNLKNKQPSYNAMRLARTSINHAYQTATIQSSQHNPFIEGIRWQSALVNVPYQTCELCADRDGKVFPVDDVPLDHPNGWCTMIPEISKTSEQVGQELRDWLDGGDNPTLDNWYDKYGDEFSKNPGFKDVTRDKGKKETVKEEPVKNEPWVFEPAEDMEEVKSRIGDALGTDNVNLGRMKTELANQYLDGVETFMNDYPELKGFLNGFDTKVRANSNGTYTIGTTPIGKFKMGEGKFTVHNNLAIRNANDIPKLYEEINGMVKNGMFFEGMDVRDNVIHELTHAMDSMLFAVEQGVYKNGAFIDVKDFNQLGWASNGLMPDAYMKTFGQKFGRESYQGTRYLGKYAMTTKQEELAQAIAYEYSGKTNPFSANVKEIFDARIKEAFKK